MSKLIQKLRETYEGPVQSIGFRLSAASPAQSMVMLMLLKEADASEPTALEGVKVDAVLVRTDKVGKDALRGIAKFAGERPWGVWGKGGTHETLRQLASQGSDFVVFDPQKTSAALTQIDGLGKVLKVDAEYKDMLLSAIAHMPVDAVLVEIEEKAQPSVTVHDLMLCRRVANVTFRPLLVVVSPELSEEDLRALWEAGAGGIVVRSDGIPSKDQIERLRQIIGKLPSKRTKHFEGSNALLPKQASATSD